MADGRHLYGNTVRLKMDGRRWNSMEILNCVGVWQWLKRIYGSGVVNVLLNGLTWADSCKSIKLSHILDGLNCRRTLNVYIVVTLTRVDNVWLEILLMLLLLRNTKCSSCVGSNISFLYSYNLTWFSWIWFTNCNCCRRRASDFSANFLNWNAMCNFETHFVQIWLGRPSFRHT